jgi:hypothetical protein
MPNPLRLLSRSSPLVLPPRATMNTGTVNTASLAVRTGHKDDSNRKDRGNHWGHGSKGERHDHGKSERQDH